MDERTASSPRPSPPEEEREKTGRAAVESSRRIFSLSPSQGERAGERGPFVPPVFDSRAVGQQPAFIAMDPHFRLEVWLTPFRYAAILATTSALEGEYPE